LSQSIELLALQEIDDEVASLTAAIEAIANKLKGDAALDDARRQLQYFDQQLKRLRSRQRRTEADIDELNTRIVPDQKRLYDGSIRSPKDLEALQKEVDFLVGNRSRLEDTLLEQLAELEEMETRRRTADERVAQLELAWETQQLELRQDSRKLEERLVTSTRRREGQVHRAQPRPLHLYEDLRRRKGGVAVAPIKGGACSGCRVQLPGAVKSRALDPDVIVQCPNCERILTLG
jgi:predicted  nucleic acid-binding Zn-ribbon protein